jgi:hypothetical protein
VATPRGSIQIVDPAAYRQHFGLAPPDVARGARVAALRLAVQDMAAAEKSLQAAGVPLAQRLGRIIVAAQSAMGATLVFEQA